jgi:hypothetical protein
VTHATSNRDEVGLCSNDVILRGGGFLVFGIVTALAVTKPPALLADGDHYREMAGKVRELARYSRSPGIRRKLVELAKRYDRRGDLLMTMCKFTERESQDRLRRETGGKPGPS